MALFWVGKRRECGVFFGGVVDGGCDGAIDFWGFVRSQTAKTV
ncbi:hypothetical protein QUB63_21370 [Microcoleus sp. ARI1-B5]